MDFEKMNKRIELQSATRSTGTRGDVTPSWSTYTTVWAAIEPLSGRELYFARQAHAEATTRITMRYNSSVAATHRVKYGSRIFQILSPPKNIEEKGKYTELLTTEIAA